jgi:hypothetical protein
MANLEPARLSVPVTAILPNEVAELTPTLIVPELVNDVGMARVPVSNSISPVEVLVSGTEMVVVPVPDECSRVPELMIELDPAWS